jgi:siroheme synthase
MAADMPLALISEATRPAQRITLTTLAAAATIPVAAITPPALVVIGEVVRASDFAQQVPGLAGRAGA